ILCFETITPSAVMPSIRGMSTSRVITSGFICCILLMAKSPSIAVATTSISSSLSSSVGISLRITAESSTTSTLIFFPFEFINPDLCAYLNKPPRVLILKRRSEDGPGVQDQHDAAVSEQRGSCKGLVLDPLGIQRLDDQLLFANQ